MGYGIYSKEVNMFLTRKDNWYIERIIWLLAGVFTLLGLVLGIWVNPNWFFLNFMVGMNQVILSLTGFCPMTAILHKIGVPSYTGACRIEK